jgi:chemotaxis protein CheD
MSVKKHKSAATIPEFESSRRHWDSALQSHVVKILPGQIYVTGNSEEALSTTLGSCVSACIWDESIRFGGMNHFMLPAEARIAGDQPSYSPWNAAARYGCYAMELLINAILKKGGDRKHLKVKVFGGAKVLPRMGDIGALNIEFVKKFLEIERFPIAAQDLGGISPRKVLFYPTTGQARVKRLSPVMNSAIASRERSYRSKFIQRDFAGPVELFNKGEMDE